MKKNLVCMFLVLLLSFTAQATHATTWNWSFNNESGKFVTDGTGSGPGTYNFIDFSLNSSAVGGTIGSLSGGQYVDGQFSTNLPYSFLYNGSSVTQWNSAGSNTFDWWVFDSQTSNISYFFGWDEGNINDATKGAWWSYGDNKAGNVTVTTTPEPASMILFGIGLVTLLGTKLKRKK